MQSQGESRELPHGSPLANVHVCKDGVKGKATEKTLPLETAKEDVNFPNGGCNIYGTCFNPQDTGSTLKGFTKYSERMKGPFHIQVSSISPIFHHRSISPLQEFLYIVDSKYIMHATHWIYTCTALPPRGSEWLKRVPRGFVANWGSEHGSPLS